MVDTQRTLSQILTLFADNENLGAISAQDLRDFVVSIMPLHPSGGDDAPQINAVRTALRALYGHAHVELSAGDFDIQSQIDDFSNGDALFGRGGSSTILLQNYWTTPLIRCQGTIGGVDVATLTADATAGARTITLDDTSGLVVDEYYLLGSDDFFSDPPDDTSGDQQRDRGEVIRILSIDSGTVITIHGYVRDDYLVASNAGLYALTFNDGFEAGDFGMINTDKGNHAASAFVQLSAVSNFVLKNITQVDSDGYGIDLIGCIDGEVHSIRGRDFIDNTGGGFLGYGIDIRRFCENLKITSSSWKNMRHGVTTGGLSGTRGIPRNITIANCEANEMNEYAFDTHVQGSGITFENCLVNNSRRGGFQIRSPNSHVINPFVNWAPIGVYLQRCAHNSSLKGGVLRHLIRNDITSYGGYGVQVQRAERVLIDSPTIDGTSRNAIWQLDGTPETTIRRPMIINPNLDGSSRPAIMQQAAGTFVGTRIIEPEIVAYSSGNPEPLSTGQFTNAVEMSSGASDYEVISVKARGGTGKIVETNGSAGVVLEKYDYSHPYTDPSAILTSEFETGRYYAPWFASSTNGSLGNGVMRSVPIYIPRRTTFDRIGLEVTSAGSAGALLRLGIYDSDESNRRPGSLILDAGTIDGTSASAQELTINQVLEPGIKWLVGVVQGAPGTQPTVRSCSPTNTPFGIHGAGSGGAVTVVGPVQSGETGALPGTFTGTGDSGVAPRVYLRAA